MWNHSVIGDIQEMSKIPYVIFLDVGRLAAIAMLCQPKKCGDLT